MQVIPNMTENIWIIAPYMYELIYIKKIKLIIVSIFAQYLMLRRVLTKMKTKNSRRFEYPKYKSLIAPGKVSGNMMCVHK